MSDKEKKLKEENKILKKEKEDLEKKIKELSKKLTDKIIPDEVIPTLKNKIVYDVLLHIKSCKEDKKLCHLKDVYDNTVDNYTKEQLKNSITPGKE